jgi:hypothetical protein
MVAGELQLISEVILERWSDPPSETELIKCDNAVQAIRRALAPYAAFGLRSTKVFAQGAYRNRTNVRRDSDIDVYALCSDSFFYDLPAGTNPVTWGLSPVKYAYAQFKDDLGSALMSFFTDGHVARGNKTFDIKEKLYRISAVVVPCFAYLDFTASDVPAEGIAFLSDEGQRIVNWPEQNYTNGAIKDEATNLRFKGVVRILKRLSCQMALDNVSEVAPIPSFLIECLLYNVPNHAFQADTYTGAIRESLRFIYDGTRSAQSCVLWTEVNGRKQLFSSDQAWTYKQVNTFIVGAWFYLGLM